MQKNAAILDGEAGLIDRLDDLACRVDRLTIHRHAPERFFEERSDIVDELRRLIADCQRRRASRPPVSLPLPLFTR